jgi:subtilase family serine protease
MKTCFKILAGIFLAMGLTLAGARQPSVAASGALPDLTVTSIKFEVVDKQADAKGNVYYIFNVYVTIHNQGKGAAEAFQVLLTRNIGESGSFQIACPTCWPTVPGLAPGEYKTLDPWQFNNAGNMNSTFSAKVDFPDNVRETDETNNTATETFRF